MLIEVQIASRHRSVLCFWYLRNRPLRDANLVFFFFNDTATTEIYTLSLHDALPIYRRLQAEADAEEGELLLACPADRLERSEEHTSELQSQSNLVCRLLLEKKKKLTITDKHITTQRYVQHSYRTTHASSHPKQSVEN